LCNVDLEQKWGDYTRVFSLMTELKKLGHHIFIMIIRPNYKHPRISYLKEKNIDVIEIHPPRIGLSKQKGISMHLNYLACLPTISKEASKIISEHKINYIYSYMPGTGTSIPAIRIKSKHKIPLILDLADMYSMIRPKRVVEKSFKDADTILVITDYLKRDLIERGIPIEKIHHIPNGVDLELFNPENYSRDEIQKIHESFCSDKLIVFTGALQDLNILIESAKKIAEHIPDFKFVIIGDHRDPKRKKSMWEKKVKDKKLEKYFEFLGRKPREEIPKYILAADVCVDSFPDEPYYAAAHPIKLLEYGSCQRPIVATSVSETSKLIKHGEYGFLATPENSDEYANYLIQILQNPTLGERIAKNFSEVIKENFSWHKLAQSLEMKLR